MTLPSQNTRILDPDLKTWMDRNRQALKNGLNCCSIGTINAFDATTQTATIQINFLRIIKGFSPLPSPVTDEAGDYKLPYPLLVNCPVMVLSGGDARLTFPIAVGDTCIVLFCDKDMDTWFSTGQINVPNSERSHDLNDAIALVGIRSMLNKLTDYSVDAVQLKYKGAVIQIDVNGVASVSDVHGERLWVSGDTKTSFLTDNHSGWLVMDGKTIGNATSGANYADAKYEALFNVIKFAAPNAGSEVFADGDTVVIPDQRGRGAVGADNMGGTNANVLTNAFTPNRNVLGGDIGEQTHTLTIPEIPAHHHTVNSVGGTGLGYTNNGFDTPSAVTGDTGGGQAHYNVPPGMIMYWFVKI